MDDELAELLPEFAAECRDLLGEIETDLIELERTRTETAGPDAERINRVFRSFHSIKGNAGFLKLDPIVETAHAAESLLGKVRDGDMGLDADRITALCEALDYVGNALEVAETQGALEGDAAECHGLVAKLRGLTEDSAPAPARPSPILSQPAPAPAANTEEVAVVEVEIEEDEPAAAAAPAPASRPSPVLSAPAAAPAPKPAPKPAPAPAPAPARAAKEDRSSGPSANKTQFVRVDTTKLDSLMNLVGELIIAERMVTHNEELAGLDLPDFDNAALQLNRITRSLQDVAMESRMVPVGGLFRKMRRIVRDIAVRQDKEINLELHGEDTDVDKTVIEQIADPLVHMVRNSCDHGIESTEVRTATGKDPAGTVRLSAEARGGEVHIVIQDDGKGLDRDRILARAVERGLVPPGRNLSDSEVWQLIFEPGFSTAEALTELSGRGVGMDVVKRNIEALRGRVDVTSTPGQGSKFTIAIPLTLAIVEGMLVRVGAETWTVPLLSIRESVCGIPEGARTELPGGGSLYRYRGHMIPIVTLEDVFGMMPEEREQELLLVLGDETRQIALLVDEVLGQRQTVVKALPGYLGRVNGVAGCSIRTNGEVSLILDVHYVIDQSTADCESDDRRAYAG